MGDIDETQQMLTYRFYPGFGKPVREFVPIPTPAPDEVLVEILAAGVCHSDIAILDPSFAPGMFTKAFTMGHEGAGVIAALGSQVPDTHPNLSVDTYVAIFGANSCNKPSCPTCSSGHDNLCTANGWHGLGGDGAWASYVSVRAACVVPVPGDIASLPPPIIAVATDAVLTPYHALKTCVGVKPGQTVLVIGCGGLGQMSIQIAKNCLGAASVLACDVRDVSLQVALGAGADYAVKPDALASLVEEKKLDVDVVIDCVGKHQTFHTAMGIVRAGGVIHVLGLGASSLEVPLLGAALKDLTVKTSFWGCKSELEEVLGFIAEGKIRPEVESRSLDQALEVLQDLEEGKLKGRVALIP